jgi:hypothetical protein
MKRVHLVCLLGSLSLFACQPAEVPEEEAVAEEPVAEAEEQLPEADRGTVEAAIGGAQVSINYGRPELKGRDMLAMLEDGQVWRLGMNEAATFETSADLTFGDSLIQAGKYSIWGKKVSADEWHLIFNSEADIWGTQRKPDNDVAEVPMTSGDLEESVERFTIELVPGEANTGELVMEWATLQLTVSFSAGA